MKKCLTMILMVAALTVTAGNKNEVPLVVQITETERTLLPEITIEMEVKQIKFGKKADTALVSSLTDVMQQLADEDGAHYVYVVTLDPQGDQLNITMHGDDPLKDGCNEKNYYGTMSLGRKHFLFARTANNEALLRTLLDKVKGKVNYVREYEIVEYKIDRLEAQVMARWANGHMTLTTFTANGENLLITE